MMRKCIFIQVALLTVVGCATESPPRPTEPLTTQLEAVEKRPNTDSKELETHRAQGFEIEHTQLGRIRYMSTGFSTMEGDFCNLFVSIEEGFISAHNGTWSGHECPWPRDGRHVPLDRKAVRAIEDAINDDGGGLDVYTFSQPEPGISSKSSIVSDSEEFEMSPLIEDTLVAHTNRLLDRWLERDVGDPLPDLSTVASLDGKFVRAHLEPHGVLVMTITTSTGSVNRLWVLDDRTLAEIRELTQVHEPTDWTDGDTDRDMFMASFGGKHTRYWPQSAPATVHRLLELTALREFGE